jgi:hypothetical protein
LWFAGAAGAGKGKNRSGAGFSCAIRSIAASEPLKKTQKKPCRAVPQFSRRTRAERLPQYEADVERADVDQQTLQNILMPAQRAAPHPTRFVAVGKAAFDQLAPPSE